MADWRSRGRALEKRLTAFGHIWRQYIRFTVTSRRPPEDILNGDCMRPRRRLVHVWRAVGKAHSQAACVRRHIVILIRIYFVTIGVESGWGVCQIGAVWDSRKGAHSSLVDVYPVLLETRDWNGLTRHLSDCFQRWLGCIQPDGRSQTGLPAPES